MMHSAGSGDPVINPASLDAAGGALTGVIIWVVIGIALIWLISFFGEGALQKFKPMIVFIAIAAFIGFIGLRAFNGAA